MAFRLERHSAPLHRPPVSATDLIETFGDFTQAAVPDGGHEFGENITAVHDDVREIVEGCCRLIFVLVLKNFQTRKLIIFFIVGCADGRLDKMDVVT